MRAVHAAFTIWAISCLVNGFDTQHTKAVVRPKQNWNVHSNSDRTAHSQWNYQFFYGKVFHKFISKTSRNVSLQKNEPKSTI